MQEVNGWLEYFARRPVGWRQDFNFSMILAALGSKAKPYEMFASLKAIERDRQARLKESPGHNLASSDFFKRIRKDTGWNVKVEV